MTHAYEALVILKTAGTDQDAAKRAAILEEPIKKLGGSVVLSQGIGRRRLAYRIARQSEGQYHLLRFQAPVDQVKELERLFRLSDVIVRFIILNAEDVGTTTDTITTAAPASSYSGYSPRGGAGRAGGTAEA